MPTLRSLIACSLLQACLFLTLLVPAQALDTPSRPVILTVTGEIGEANRPPYDEERDAFFAYHEKSFDKAAVFDVPMLMGLGMHSMILEREGLEAPLRLEGPLLSDLLKAVGAAGKSLTVLALDGYASEISAGDLEAYEWMLALKQDGSFFGLGQRGPLWLVYQRRDGEPLTAADEERWPWAAFLIEIK